MKTITQLVQQLKNTFSDRKNIAPVESSSTASRAYAVGKKFFYNNILYRCTAAIASGGKITPGTNCVAESDVETQIDNTVAEVNSLKEAFLDQSFTNGTVNLYKNTANSQVKNGVTFTVNDDGTVTANGTATATTTFSLGSRTFTVGKKYKLTGSPSGSSSNTYYLVYYNGTNYALDYGSGYTFTAQDNNAHGIDIVIKQNQTVSNVVFKPMITLADMPNSDYNHYVPYAMSNKKLTDAIASKAGTFSASSMVSTNALEFRQFGKVVAVNGYLTLNGNQTADGATSNELGTVSGIDLPNTNRAVRALCGIAANAWDFPTEVGYITLTTAGSLQLKTHTSGTQNVYFSFSYVVA